MLNRNVDLLRTVAMRIEDDPDSYNQDQWVCESACCIAGHGLLASGNYNIVGTNYHQYGFVRSQNDISAVSGLNVRTAIVENLNAIRYDIGKYYWDASDGDSVFGIMSINDIHVEATDALGLTNDEADILFDQSWRPNCHLTVPQALEKLAGGSSIEEVTCSYDYDRDTNCDCDD